MIKSQLAVMPKKWRAEKDVVNGREMFRLLIFTALECVLFQVGVSLWFSQLQR